jgi:hypothetical protein
LVLDSFDDLGMCSINLGNGRVIPESQARSLKVHRTVKLRMEAEGKEKYMPKARWEVEPTWVD